MSYQPFWHKQPEPARAGDCGRKPPEACLTPAAQTAWRAAGSVCQAMPPTGVRAGQPWPLPLRRAAHVLRAIEAYLRRYNRPPTVHDLCRETGISSTSYVFYLLAGLELDGYLTRAPGVSRSIRLTRRPGGVPIVGTIGTIGTITAIESSAA